MVWSPELSGRGNDEVKCKYDIVRYTRGKVLDLGCGPWKAFPHFLGIDNRAEWTDLPWNPDYIMDATDLSCFASSSWDAVFSSHLLQILGKPEQALKEWWRVIKPGGYLCLYLPHKDLYPNVGQEGCHPLHKWDFIPKDISDMMGRISEHVLIENETRADDNEYSFLQVYHKDQHYHVKSFPLPDQKSAIVLRYGGIGDSVQAASILPQLKEQGYHVTFLTQPDGYDILKHDPHIDEFFVKDRNQVPVEELGQFWAALRKKYDKFINLTETVEVGMLVVPQMTAHKWPKSVREERFNENYLEFTHKIAELPYEPNPRFYATPKEKTWAKKWKRKKDARMIMWCCSGSSIHKAWPYMDQMIARIMLTYKDVKVVLVGEELDRLLDSGWEEESRVIKKAGKWSIRQTLAMAEKMDLVIGPETGVLNAVSHLEVPKILHLSHSSVENLSRDWINCINLLPDCECYPCHQLNTSFEQCPKHETGVAMCQGSIDPERMWTAIQEQLR